MSAFTEEDEHLFFGREEFVEQLVKAVKKHPLVPVIGASGSGKSSVVFAGLIPRLRAEGTWLIQSFRPENQPFYKLASALVRLLKPELDEIDLGYRFMKTAWGKGYGTEAAFACQRIAKGDDQFLCAERLSDMRVHPRGAAVVDVAAEGVRG